ncbi:MULTISPECIES: formylglycine-generating enzyme family protein [unclassified Microcoleus]|uniref:formylglycine-generating enzyme family protein n=1 Tax=unclassified Microcoleus TaxID=2642155 RepID=UPI002FD40186
MTANQSQPREYDAVKGGESQVPLAAAVLGGISGVKSRLASPIVEVKIAALSEALKYGEAGLDLIIGTLQDESMAVKFAAYSLLKDRDEPKIKQQLQNYLPIFEFDVITVDAEGKENSRHSSSAHFFPEDLGNKVVLEMVYIPEGTFMMGSPTTRERRDDSENPQHQVTVPAFYAGKYPIIQAQWQAMMGNNPSKFKGEKLPVEQVSWQDAIEFCDKLSQTTGKKYRLLSEAEWEYACRAGTTTPFYFGETITPKLANYDGGLPYENGPRGVRRRKTTDVGIFPPNAFGLYDMHGNVLELCSDKSHYSYNSAPTDGSYSEMGADNSRNLCGGSWYNVSARCRSASRYAGLVDYNWANVGFRVAVTSVSLLS